MANISTSTVPRSSLILVVVFLAVAAAAVPAAASAAVETAKILREILNNMLEAIPGNKEELKNLWEEHFGKKEEDERIRAFRNGPLSGAIRVVSAGSIDFSVGAVDVISAVTSTSQCGSAAASRRVPCGDPLCKKYGAGGQCSASGGAAAKMCSSGGGDDALSLGDVSLSTYAGRRAFSDNTVYACSPGGGKTSGHSAVIGLSRGSILANSSQRFAYIMHNKSGSFLWLGDDVPARGGSTTKLITVDTPGMDPNLYYVNVTGIKVGDGSVKENAAAGIIITTFPFTMLNPVLFGHLKQKLSAEAKEVEPDFRKVGQLCYANGMKLPAITLVFAGADAVMKLEPEHYSYNKSNGALCLTILPSKLEGGVSIIGSMLQVGRQMSYDLEKNTLTFEASTAASPSLSPSASPKSSSSSSGHAAALTPVFLTSAWAWLAALLIAMVMSS